MSTAERVAEFRQAQKDLLALAYRDLVTFWRTVDPTDARSAVLALEAYLPELIQTYGEAGATVAADFYEELRDQSPAARRAYAAILGDAVPAEQIRASARWAADPLFSARPDATAALARVVSMTDRYVKASSRNTVTSNIARDPAEARFARVPTGRTTCAFCLLLASRGAVYASKSSAGDDMNKYHSHCDCIATPVWDGDALPYDREGMLATYKRALRESPTGDLKGADGVLSKIREIEGVR